MGAVGLGFRAPARMCEPAMQVILNVGDSVITSFGVTWFLHYVHSLGFRLEEIQGSAGFEAPHAEKGLEFIHYENVVVSIFVSILFTLPFCTCFRNVM